MQNWYAIALNEWIFDKKIRVELRLLLCISSLTASDWVCFASNTRLAEKFGTDETTISRQIKKLEQLWYIIIEYEKRWSEITKRNIRLAKMLTDDMQKCQSTISKNAKDNNTSNNITSINIYNNKKSFLEIFEKEINNEEFISILKAKYNLEDAYLKKVAGDFCLYRTEKNPNGRKEKWQMQKTFDIKRRFYTRLSNDQKYSKKTTFTPKNSIWVIE